MDIAKQVILRSRLSLMIGYYGDMLFTQNPEAFKKSSCFLFESIGESQGPLKVIALQSVDTLTTIVVDADIAQRFMAFLPDIIEIIKDLIAKVRFPQFFEFVLEFIKYYCRVLNELVLELFNALVRRVCQEQTERQQKSDPSSVIINKSMNILRMIIEKKEYISAFPEQLQEGLKPLFLFMADPTKIPFYEYIIIILKSFIKKTNRVSPTDWEIFHLFPLVLAKNSDSFGNLLDTINTYLLVGKAEVATNPKILETIAGMANTALFTQKTNQTINNTEGAILIQIMF